MTDSDSCPLCGRTVAGDGDLRAHLMTSHRKSELTDRMLALLDEVDDAPLAAP